MPVLDGWLLNYQWHADSLFEFTFGKHFNGG